MKYYLLNELNLKRYEKPVLLKVPNIFYVDMQKCIKYNQLAAKYEKKCIEHLAKTNNLSITEIDDIMAENDWCVDQLSYGNNGPIFGEITKEEYLELKRIL